MAIPGLTYEEAKKKEERAQQTSNIDSGDAENLKEPTPKRKIEDEALAKEIKKRRKSKTRKLIVTESEDSEGKEEFI